jgi:hypothetical protein
LNNGSGSSKTGALGGNFFFADYEMGSGASFETKMSGFGGVLNVLRLFWLFLFFWRKKNWCWESGALFKNNWSGSSNTGALGQNFLMKNLE